MKTVVISNGTIEDYQHVMPIINNAGMVICADGGGMHAYKMGIIPNALIGDFDSIDTEVLEYFREKGVEIIRHQCEKDETDTQLAVEYAVQKGAEEVCMLGCIGSRFDHSFANVGLLIWLMEKGIKGCIKNYNNEIYVMDRQIKLEGNAGEKLSLLPVSKKVSGIYTSGLKYVLKDGELYCNVPRGISNEFTGRKAEITIKDGVLLVIKSND